MPVDVTKFSMRHRDYLAKLIEHGSVGAAALDLGIKPGTIHRAFQINKELRQAWREGRVQGIAAAVFRLAERADDAVTLICKALDGTRAITAIELKVCSLILDRADALILQTNLEADIAALKAKLADGKQTTDDACEASR